ncbi:hypothetical protein BGX23_010953 [Mortierella sp. AD031]|nr:hypothetical protein BGX23_010953 [Mortierella sp. AD031]
MAASVNGTYTRFQSLLTLGLDKGLPTKEMTGAFEARDVKVPNSRATGTGLDRRPTLLAATSTKPITTLSEFGFGAANPGQVHIHQSVIEDCLPETIYSNLQYLEARSKVTSKVILVLLSRLPNLQHLLLGGIEDGSVIDLDAKEILGNRPSRLRTLHLEELEFAIPNGYFATSILPWLPALTKFRTDQLYDTITRGLVAQCQDLQIFGRLSPYYSIGRTVYERKHVVSILPEGCPKLREVDAIHHIITANRLIHSAWSCETRLEKFHCQIVGVERLQHIELPVLNRMIESGADPSSDQEWEVMRRFLESRDQQPQVLGRIARLTQLRILDVGYEYRAFLPGGSGQAWMIHDKPMPDTLELPLDA